MKTRYFFFLCMLSTKIFAQSYIPFPESNAVWIQGSFLYSGYNNHELTTITQPLYFGNDTVVNGNLYHSLHGHAIADWVDGWGNQQSHQNGTDFLADEVRVLFRQDIPNKRIYQLENNSNQEQILYDFNNLVIGQPYPHTINNLDYPQILVMASDSILLNDGLYHDRWILGSNSNDSGFVSIIEGMGSTMGFDLPISIPFEQTSATLCFAIDGNSVYDGWANANWLILPRYSDNCMANVNTLDLEKDNLNVKIGPIPSRDVLYIKSNQQIQKLILVDLTGRIVIEKNINKESGFDLSITDLKSGNYILKIYFENKQCISRQIVRY